MDVMPGGWNTPEVARAQRTLVELQLAAPQMIGPFHAFLEAMRHIPIKTGTFLDLGCGVGHYGVLLARYYPELRYSGYDASPAMIAEARRFFPAGRFRVRPFWKSNLKRYDIVMASQVLEYQDDPWQALAFLLMRPGYTILHRLRVTPGISRWLRDEPTYCGHRADNYLWNVEQVREYIAAWGCRVRWSAGWEQNVTLVVTR